MIAASSRRLITLAALAVLVGATFIAAAGTQTNLTSRAGQEISAIFIDAEPDAWPPDDASLYLAEGPYSIQGLYGSGVVIHVLTVSASPTVVYTITILPPAGKQLAVGTYEGATNSATPGPPRLLLSVVPCLATIGRFTVHEIEVNDVELIRFAASFEHHCPGSLGARFGEVRYRSSVPVDAVMLSPVSGTFSPGQTRTITVTNRGTTAQNIGVEVRGRSPDDFEIVASTCGQLAPESSCTVDVSFAGVEGGARDAMLVVVDQTARAVRTASLVGTGLPATSVALSVAADPTASPTPVRLTATVGATTGVVEFLHGTGYVLGSSSIGADGTASLDVLLPAGTHWITASALAPGYARSESLPVLVTVSP